MIFRGFFLIFLFLGPGVFTQTQWTTQEYSQDINLEEDTRFSQVLDFSTLDYPLLNSAIFLATNEIRKAQGRAELKHSVELERSAWNFAKRMAEKSFFSHEDPTDSGRKTLEQRGKRAGILNPRMAENIATTFGVKYHSGDPVYSLQGGAGGYSLFPFGEPIPPHTYRSLARALLEQWMNSPGHRSNILSPYALEMGTGAYFYRDSQDLNGMPMFACVQNFQWYEPIKPIMALDPDPF